MANISTNNARLTVKFENYGAIVIDNFDPDSDIWAPSDRQTADGEVTPDGAFNYWAINAPIEATLTVSGASTAARRLRTISDAHTRRGDTQSVVEKATVIIELNGETTTYYDGVMTSTKAGAHLGNQKLQSQTFNFKFGGVK
jgi:hypothetical protein